MIRYTGTFKNKTVDKPTPVTYKELAEHFGVDIPTDENPIFLEFAQDGGAKLIKKDRFGQTLSPPSVSLQTSIEINTTMGDSMVLEYVTPETRQAKGRVKLTDVRTKFSAKDAEKAVFLQIHPACGTSKVAIKKWLYTIVNPRAQRDAKYAIDVRKHQLQNDILITLPWDALRIKASGLVVKGKNIRGKIKDGEAAVRSELILLLAQYPAEFFEAWDKDNTVFDGMLWVALEQQLIVRAQEGQRNILRFSEALGGRRILYLKGGSEFEQLVAATNIDTTIMQTIRNYMEQEQPRESKAPQKQSDGTDDDIIGNAEALNLLRYIPDTLTVMTVTKKGGENELVTFTTGELAAAGNDWREALKRDFLKNKHHRQSLALTLRHANGVMQPKRDSGVEPQYEQ